MVDALPNRNFRPDPSAREKVKFFFPLCPSLISDLTWSELDPWGGGRWIWLLLQRRCWFCASGSPELRPIAATRRGTLSLSTPTRSVLSITLGEVLLIFGRVTSVLIELLFFFFLTFPFFHLFPGGRSRREWSADFFFGMKNMLICKVKNVPPDLLLKILFFF